MPACWMLPAAVHTSEQARPSPPTICTLPLPTRHRCAQPEPCWGPEAVCQAQLDALAAGDAGGVFRFASPQNQAATGPPERFAQMLEVRRLWVWAQACTQNGFGSCDAQPSPAPARIPLAPSRCGTATPAEPAVPPAAAPRACRAAAQRADAGRHGADHRWCAGLCCYGNRSRRCHVTRECQTAGRGAGCCPPMLKHAGRVCSPPRPQACGPISPPASPGSRSGWSTPGHYACRWGGPGPPQRPAAAAPRLGRQ